MNKQRRELIAGAVAKLEEAKADLETARDEERNYLDALPGHFKSAGTVRQAQKILDGLGNTIFALAHAIVDAEQSTKP